MQAFLEKRKTKAFPLPAGLFRSEEPLKKPGREFVSLPLCYPLWRLPIMSRTVMLCYYM